MLHPCAHACVTTQYCADQCEQDLSCTFILGSSSRSKPLREGPTKFTAQSRCFSCACKRVTQCLAPHAHNHLQVCPELGRCHAGQPYHSNMHYTIPCHTMHIRTIPHQITCTATGTGTVCSACTLVWYMGWSGTERWHSTEDIVHGREVTCTAVCLILSIP